MKVYKGVNLIAMDYDSNKNRIFEKEVAKAVEKNQNENYQVEIQYSTSATNGTLVFTALILSYVEI